MPLLSIERRGGEPISLEIPPPGTGASCFLIGLPKAGSTLLNRIMRPLTERGGLVFFSLQNALNAAGVATASVEVPPEAVFQPEGYAYGGFRGVDVLSSVPAFARGRTIFLIRDPRDMLSSLYFSEAISHRPPGTAQSKEAAEQFEARRSAALAETIDAFARRRAAGVLATYRNAVQRLEGVEHRLYRYEDVIHAKLDWVQDMIAYLGLKVPRPVVEAVVARNDVTPESEDPTQHIRRVSPGDYREKFDADTIAWLNAQFAEQLARFGYAIDGNPNDAAARSV